MNQEFKKIVDNLGYQLNITLLEEQLEDIMTAVVKECTTIIEQNYAGMPGTYAGAHNSAIVKCKDSINKHFGLEK